MEEAANYEMENHLASQMVNQFADHVEKLFEQNSEMGLTPIYTALSLLLCERAVLDGMSLHTLMEGVMVTYQKLKSEYEEKVQ